VKQRGFCKPCGGSNELACPKINSGYPCRGSFEPNTQNICKPCGGAGQKACRALKTGARCNSGLKNISGLCQSCGGPNERACPKLAKGFPCRGDYSPNRANICKPCGGVGQLACRALKAAPQCAVGSTERKGVCASCGSEGERACKITDKGAACKKGLKRGLNGICKASVEELTRRAAMAELKKMSADVLPALTMAMNVNKDSKLKQRVRSEDSDAANSMPDNNLCLGKNYDSWTVGVGGEAGVVVSVEGEVGAAFRCADHAKGQKDSK
jgi:hypothetical protein